MFYYVCDIFFIYDAFLVSRCAHLAKYSVMVIYCYHSFVPLEPGSSAGVPQCLVFMVFPLVDENAGGL